MLDLIGEIPSLILYNLKLICEIAAYGGAALFLLVKFVSGQVNAGTEVALELKRYSDPANDAMDDLSILIKLKRTAIGRLELKDIQLEVSDPRPPVSGTRALQPSTVQINRAIICERETAPWWSAKRLSVAHRETGTFLPPGDATQLAFHTQVKRTEPVLIDATILARRTFWFWLGKPQWRASAISFPEPVAAAAQPAPQLPSGPTEPPAPSGPPPPPSPPETGPAIG